MRVRLNRSLTAQVTTDHAGRTLVVHGIRSARPLRTLSRAIASFGAFGRCDRVLLDLTHLRDRSPKLAAALVADARRSAASGRCLVFASTSHLTGRPVETMQRTAQLTRDGVPMPRERAAANKPHWLASAGRPRTGATGVPFDPASTLPLR